MLLIQGMVQFQTIETASTEACLNAKSFQLNEYEVTRPPIFERHHSVLILGIALHDNFVRFAVFCDFGTCQHVRPET